MCGEMERNKLRFLRLTRLGGVVRIDTGVRDALLNALGRWLFL
jgi:hypothetical protein